METHELQAMLDELQPQLMTIAAAAVCLNSNMAVVANLIANHYFTTLQFKAETYLFYGEVARYRSQQAIVEGYCMDVRYPENQFKGVNPILHTLFHTGAVESTHKSFHAAYIGHIRDFLNDQFGAQSYRATCEDTLNIGKAFYPDVLVRRDQPATPLPPTFAKLTAPSEPANVATPDLIAITTPPDSLPSVIIRAGQTPVTVIEFLSPSNLNRREYLESYREKRQRILDLGVNMVELHYLPTYPSLWDNLPIYPDDPTAKPYQIAVTQPRHQNAEGKYLADMYLFGIHQAIPTVAIPLLNDETIACNFETSYQEAYQRGGRFGLIVNYADIPQEITTLFNEVDCAKILERSQEICATYSLQYPD